MMASTVFDDLPDTAVSPPAERLRTTMAAVRLSFTWLGVRKTLTPQQKAQAAESFGAQGPYLSAGKKLLDTRHPAFQAVTAVRNRAQQYWKGVTLPYPEPGIRLIKQERIAACNAQFEELREDLATAVADLERHYADLKEAARERLGDLFDPADYPPSLDGLFAMEWDYPAVEPPEYLRELHPELYQQECARVQARFEEAVRMAEAAFVSEFSELVTHLGERLSGKQDGKPKIFRDSVVTRLQEFFERFRQLNIGSSAELDRLVEDARQIAQGVAPQDLRENRRLRRHVAQELARVQAELDGLMVDRPRRNLLRPRRPEDA